MSIYDPLGKPIAPGVGTPKYTQNIVPVFDQALVNAQADVTSDSVTHVAPPGLLVRARDPSATIADDYNKAVVTERSKWDAVFNAIYNPA